MGSSGARSRAAESDEGGAASEGMKPQGGGGGARHGEIMPSYASIAVLSTVKYSAVVKYSQADDDTHETLSRLMTAQVGSLRAFSRRSCITASAGRDAR